MTLVEPSEGIPIERVQIPQDLYWVLMSPAPLAGMQFPALDFPWSNLHAAGFDAVVALHLGMYDPHPLSGIFSQKLQDLIGGVRPDDEERELRIIRVAVNTTVSALCTGQGVVVHCAGGRGRTGTVLGCVLRELGLDSIEVIEYLDRLHKGRGKAGWPESDWQSELVRKWNAPV